MSEKLIRPYFTNKFPEFVEADHPVFKDFVEAYYEYMEKVNTGTTSSSSDIYKALPNPGALVSDVERHINIDDTLDSFVDYFRRQVIPIGIPDTLTDTRFIIKRMRDVYLSKGTPKSFRLLFRLLYNTDIDFFEPQQNIISASDGSYVTLNIAYFRIIDFSERLDDITFRLAQLRTDSDSNIGTIVAGTIVGRDEDGNQIIKVQLADNYSLELGDVYRVVDPVDSRVFLRVRAVPTISQIDITDPGGLYTPASIIDIKSKQFGTTFKATPITNLTGRIDEVYVRNRGSFYKVGDTFTFNTDSLFNGSGGGFTITGVDEAGRVTEIDGATVRSGVLNNGFYASTFEDVRVPVSNGGRWRKIPDRLLYSATTLPFKGAAPYLPTDQRAEGVGLQATPISNTAGTLTGLLFAETPYFLDSDDVEIIVPVNLVVEDLEGLRVNDTVSFQTFILDSDGDGKTSFSDDSETVTHTFRIKRKYDDEYGKFWTDVEAPLYFGYDSDLFQWQKLAYFPDSEAGIRGYVEVQYRDVFFDSDMDTVGNEAKRITRYNVDYTLDSDHVIDAGEWDAFTIETEDISRHEYDSGLWAAKDVSAPELGLADAPDTFISNHPDSHRTEFDASSPDGISIKDTAPAQTLTVTFKDNDFINQLDKSHFLPFNEHAADDVKHESILYREKVPYTPTAVGATRVDNPQLGWDNLGSWGDSGFYGKISAIDGKIVSIIPAFRREDKIPTVAQLEKLSRPKYTIIRLAKVVGDTTPTEAGLTLSNILVDAKAAQLSFSLAANTESTAKFIDESGFLSSSSGGILQDNSFYSNHTYILQTDIPIEQWRDKIKTIAHPAGKILYSELNINQFVPVSNYEADNFTTNANNSFKFDSSLEHSGSASDYNEVAITADTTPYKSNAFETTETINADNTSLKADSYSIISNAAERAQYGNAFFDFEPVGYVLSEKVDESFIDPDWKRWAGFDYETGTASNITNFIDSEVLFSAITTQDSDGNNFLLNREKYFSRWNGQAQDLYKTNSRTDSDYRIAPPIISRVRFADTVNQIYNVWSIPATDSESRIKPDDTLLKDALPNNFFFRFGDSDAGFESIKYSGDYFVKLIDTVYDSDFIHTSTSPNRFKEIVRVRERDFNVAMRNNREMEFKDGSVTYYDEEAFERKWNQINQQRTINTDGWQIPGAASMYLNISQHRRRYLWTSAYDRFGYDYSLVKTPLMSNVWDITVPTDTDDHWEWNKYYIPTINNNNISVEIKSVISDHRNEDSESGISSALLGSSIKNDYQFMDPQISMRNRRR